MDLRTRRGGTSLKSGHLTGEEGGKIKIGSILNKQQFAIHGDVQ